jgi:hypothetical protein
MSKCVLVIATATGIAFVGWAGPAAAFIPGQSPLIVASQQLSDTIEVKWKKWKKTPPGWSKGRKVGWGRGTVPPGHQR